MKKLLLLFLVAVTILSFGGCSPKPSEQEFSSSLPSSSSSGESVDMESSLESMPSQSEEEEQPTQTASSPSSSSDSHTHNYKTTLTKAPTCTQKGEQVTACSCGEQKNQSVEATGHSWSGWETVKKATATQTGKAQKTCTVCGETQTKTLEKISQTQESNGRVTAKQLEQIKAGFLQLVNEERKSLGLGTLTYNSHLEEVALIRSQEIMTLFSHDRPGGGSCFSLVDPKQYSYSTLGENISYTPHAGAGSYGSKDQWVGSASQIQVASRVIFEGFKNSPPHYESMINGDFEHCGIGISLEVSSESYGVVTFYVAHIFGAD